MISESETNRQGKQHRELRQNKKGDVLRHLLFTLEVNIYADKVAGSCKILIIQESFNII
jgi:hypothetical protein